MIALRHMSLCALAALVPVAAQATTVVDPKGDFVIGYNDAAPDLDVLSFSVEYDAASRNFTLGATMAGAINPATVGVYIIGVNTGTGPNAPFAALGAPDVRFNQTVRVNKDGNGLVGTNPISVTISGSSFTAVVPLSLLPPMGFSPETYGWNLWPRNGTGAGTFVTDFAPNNGLIAAVPEPASWVMMMAGIGAVGVVLRRRRRAMRQAHAC